MAEAGINSNQVDYVIFYDKPFLKFDRILETYLAFAPRGLSSFIKFIPIWLKEKLFQKRLICNEFMQLWGKDINFENRLLFSEHHLSHAASAFYPSPFNSSAILTIDGVGEWTTTSIAVGKFNSIKIIKEMHFPHSLGLLYSAVTYYLGFKVNSGEYKVMGLAPYGKPIYADLIKSHLINIKDDGSFALDMQYFNYCTGFTMTSKKFNNLFGAPPRKPESKLTQRDMDIAASIQSVLEEVVIKLAKHVAKITGEENLCLAGGVALNCVANGKLLNEKIFKNIWVQPASGDSGGAVGAAFIGYHFYMNKPRYLSNNGADKMKGSYLGPDYSQEQIEYELKQCGANYETFSTNELIGKTASLLANGNAGGWMNGRMEFGPRSLGSRSILADPRSADMQKKLNLKIKFRESFRPFAPSILKEKTGEYFELEKESPYMLFVAEVKNSIRIQQRIGDDKLFGIEKLNVTRSLIPAVTHVDYSARVQTVGSENYKFELLLKNFHKLTGIPILINTSFNVRGEPIVCSPTDAFKCFMGTNLDFLVIGDCLLHKTKQNKELFNSYTEKYELD